MSTYTISELQENYIIRKSAQKWQVSTQSCNKLSEVQNLNNFLNPALVGDYTIVFWGGGSLIGSTFL